MTGVPIGRAASFVSATGLPFTVDGEPGAGLGTPDGLMVGKRPAAFPPGLRVEPGTVPAPTPPPPMVGRLPTGSGEVLVLAPVVPVPVLLLVCVPVLAPVLVPVLALEDLVAAGAVTATAIDSVGFATRPVALPTTVRLTDFTVEAVAGTVTRAMTCRSAA